MDSLSESLWIAIDLVVAADPTLLNIVGRSLHVSLLASVFACLAGAAFGAWLGTTHFRGRPILLLSGLLVVTGVLVVTTCALLERTVIENADRLDEERPSLTQMRIEP